MNNQPSRGIGEWNAFHYSMCERCFSEPKVTSILIVSQTYFWTILQNRINYEFEVYTSLIIFYFIIQMWFSSDICLSVFDCCVSKPVLYKHNEFMLQLLSTVFVLKYLRYFVSLVGFCLFTLCFILAQIWICSENRILL